ncbi:MAG: DUF1080 domain-containing protein [Kiritimatiellae bacterium]|nr:DUF1080 domain-containing protein [Kiritimatiellia bacterium]HHU13616.1 DUF1080 domain-containing protein [Lentisphaerota bacterium]
MVAALAAGSAATVMAGLYGDTPDALHAWAVHDMNRPVPKKITAEPGQPPSDAIVLFDGTSLDNWESTKGEPTKWRLVDGALESVKGAGYIRTKQSFGDCQLHIEWAAPIRVEGQGQGRGNSGVFLMGNYEIQVLDSYETEVLPDGSNKNPNYADGQAASVYAENPPMVNACRKPGEWQTYDIVFHQPIWEGETLKWPGSVTVFHNGVLVQDHWEMEGLTTHCRRRPLKPHANKLPLQLQDHGNPVRFRNIWLREIPSRYANTTHGGPAANEADVMALRRETAAKLYARANPADPNKAAALHRLLEVISYEKTEPRINEIKTIANAYLAELGGMDKQKLEGRKGEIIGLRNAFNVLIRNKVLPEDCTLRAGLQKIINEQGFEKKR